MKHNTDKEKATACQKTPADKANMKTDTQTEQPGTADIDAALDRQKAYTRKLHEEVQQIISTRTQASDAIDVWRKAYAKALGQREAYKAQADKLAEELRKLIEITPYSGTISARETLDAYDNER